MKRFLAALIIACVIPAAAYATDTRIQSLGGKEKFFTVHDESNALVLPSTLLFFTNLVYLDAGLQPGWAVEDTAGSNIPYNAGFGVHYGLGENTVIAFYGSSLSRYVSGNLLDRAFGGDGLWAGASYDVPGAAEQKGNKAIHNADHKGTALFAQRLGKIRLGVGLSFWGDNYSITDPESDLVTRGGTLFEGTLGLGFDIDGTDSVDLAVKALGGTFDDGIAVPTGSGGSEEVTRFSSDLNWGVGLLGRAVFGIPGGEKIVPYLSVDVSRGGFALNTETDGVSDQGTVYQVAAGTDVRIQPLDRVFIYPGIGVAVIGIKGTETVGDTEETFLDDMAWLAPFVSASVDAQVLDWLAFRFGARQSVIFRSWETAAQRGKDNDTLTEITIGSNLHFKNFDIDFMVNPELFLEGPALFTGREWNDGMAFQSALRFQW
jgi:hypothetical protein